MIKNNNVLYFDGCNTVELAKKYGTPLYLISETHIVDRCNEIKSSFLSKYENTRAIYASKAFLPLAMCKIIEREGLGLDVVSGGELYTAIKAGFPNGNIDFNGNNKSRQEIELAVEYQISRIVVDNPYELDLLIDVCNKKKKNISVELKNKYNFDTKDLDIGGGFGIHYTDEDDPKPLSYFIDPAMKLIEDFCRENKLIRPKVIIEPGRWIIGEAGITMYEIGSIKKSPSSRKYVSIDGGMSDNIRPCLYQAKYDAVIANKINEDNTDLVSISGKFCESSDILIKDIKLPIAAAGDYLAVFSTGAYNYSMASNYNKNIIPSVLLLNNGKEEIIVKRQDYDDILRNEIIPASLGGINE